jgi:hypothetical protein
MEILTAARYYWQVVCRIAADTFDSFGIRALVISVFGIALAVFAHVAIVRWFPGLKDKLGEPMTRVWVWAVYTLLPFGGVALVLMIYNTIMAPVRIYNDLASKPSPAPVGDPQDAADIRSLTRKLLDTEGKLEHLTTDYEKSEQKVKTVELQRDDARRQLDNREAIHRRRNEIAEWIGKIESFQNSLSNETPRTPEEFNKFSAEFMVFSRQNLEEGEIALLNSTVGLPQHLTARNLTGDQLEMFKILWRWGLRLNQFMAPVDYSNQGLIPGIIN